MTYPVVRQQVAAGALVLSGWWFDIGSGTMYTYERNARSFVPIDQEVAERMIARLAASAGTSGLTPSQDRAQDGA